MKFLLGFTFIILSFFQAAQAASYNNCQITGYEAHTNVAPDFITRFSAYKKIKVSNWEGCFIQATLFTQKYTYKNNKFGSHHFQTSKGPVFFLGTLERIRIFKWIYKHANGTYSSGIISKYSDSNVIEPIEGFYAYDAKGFLLDIDTSIIEKN